MDPTDRAIKGFYCISKKNHEVCFEKFSGLFVHIVFDVSIVSCEINSFWVFLHQVHHVKW